MAMHLRRQYPRARLGQVVVASELIEAVMANLRSKWLIACAPLVVVGIFALPYLVSAHSLQDPQETPAQPDNTKKNLPTNHRDANRADQQSDTSSDVELTRKIRQAVSQDKTLSTYAHNVKIITRDGIVHLKGPVRSQAEKDSVEAKASDIAGASNVKNELTIKTASGQ
jgi:hyperosmotically inducible periplasmic protein